MTSPDIPFGNTALVTVDLQLSLAPEAFPAPVREALRRRLAAFRAADRPIIHALGGHLRAENLGQALDAALLPGPDARLYAGYLARGYLQRLGAEEMIMHKPGWGAFTRTALGSYLRARGVSTVAVAGIAFAPGTRATLFEARAAGFSVALLEDATAGLHALAKAEAARIGVSLRGGGPEKRGVWVTHTLRKLPQRSPAGA